MVPFRAHLARLNPGRRPTAFPRLMRSVSLALLCLTWTACAKAVDTNVFLDHWFAAQSSIHTWSANLLQTRTLKALAQPLTAKGRVWYKAPNLFRWELGTPPRTIAIRETNRMLLIYPRLKRAERYPISSHQHGPAREVLDLLQAGFPENRHAFEQAFTLLSVTTAPGVYTLAMQIKHPAAQPLISQISVTFRTNDFSLLATKVRFTDGSTLRNDFTNIQVNPKLSEGLFSPHLDTNYTIVSPLGH